MPRRLIHEAVTRQVLSSPEATAVISGEQRFTYLQLETQAEEYAARLRGQGVGPGHRVPVVLPRSARLVAVLLGVLKCGAAYAALDRRWPAPRLEQLVRGLRPPLVVADAAVPDAGVPVWTPDQDARWDGVVEPDPLVAGSASTDGSSIASLFFTSGTTGTPKGVLSPHRATTRLFRAPTFAMFGPGRVMAQTAPVSWDAFSLELWGMLTTGGTIVIHEGDYFLPAGLRQLVETAEVDTVWLTSSLLNLFVDEDIQCFAGVRQVLTGGERLSVPHVRAFLAEYPETALINGYGPVESCVFATTHRVRPADCDLPYGIPIGRPVPETGVHLLDGTRPVPAGEVGEICLSGAGLAHGYLDDPRATAERFVTLPLDDQPTEIYRTGDLGTVDSTGVLHFRGREDRQVKVAGHRIEPTEIEAAARAVPGVTDCAVVPVPGRDGGAVTRLVLFYTADARRRPAPRELRRALSAVLPRHMVPHQAEPLDALPVTDHGKLDRAGLLRSLTVSQIQPKNRYQQ